MTTVMVIVKIMMLLNNDNDSPDNRNHYNDNEMLTLKTAILDNLFHSATIHPYVCLL